MPAFQEIIADVGAQASVIADLRLSKLAHFDRMYSLEDFMIEQDSQRLEVFEPVINCAVESMAARVAELRVVTDANAAKMTSLVDQELKDPSPISLPPPGRIKQISMVEVRSI